MPPSASSIFAHARTQPSFERRGLMLDISRNRVPTMAWLKTLIDALVLLRYNELQLYTEHTFAYAQHAAVWQHASPMTAAQIAELDHYCAARGIELVPNQNSFGHMERWLRHQNYQHLAECPNGFEHPIAGWRSCGGTLAPTADSAAFIDSLYTELLPHFSSNQLHIGGDEPWELGQGRSAQRIALEGKHAVYLEFLNRLFTLAEQHGRQPQFWADIILERPDLVPQLPKHVTPVIWGYDADSPFEAQCRIVAEAGFRQHFYVAPGAGNWNSFGGRLDVAHANIARAAQAGQAHGARGLLLTAWGDNGHHQPWPTLFPSLILAAQAAWGCPICECELAAQIDALFYPEAPAGHGAALCALGGIDALLPQPAPPSSFLHSALFASDAHLTELLHSTDDAALQQVLDALDAISTAGLDPEIELGATLNRIATQRCLELQRSGESAQFLAEQLQPQLERFARLWHTRSRSGGLQESLERLHSAGR